MHPHVTHHRPAAGAERRPFRLLIVEDEKRLALSLAKGLMAEGTRSTWCTTGWRGCAWRPRTAMT